MRSHPIMCRLLTILVLSLLINVLALANPGHMVRTFNVRDGLPSNSISSVIQDDNGLIWIGTWNGLSFYDGYRFFTFRSSPQNGSLSTNRMLKIMPDSLGNVWLITYDHKISVLDNSVGEFKPVSAMTDAGSNAEAFDAAEFYRTRDCLFVSDRAGKMLMRIDYTSDENQYKVNIDSICDVVPGACRFIDILNDDAGNYWILTDNAAVSGDRQMKVSGRIKDIASIGDETYLIDREGRLYVCKEGKTRELATLSGFGRIKDMEAADDSHIAVGTDRGYAVYNLKLRKWMRYDIPAGVEKVNVDSSRRVWIFTGDKRIAYCTGDSAPEFPDTESTGVGRPRTSFEWPFFIVDNYGTVWMAPAEGRLVYFDETSHRLVPSHILSPLLKYTALPEVEKFFVDDNNNLWVISAHGLSLINFKYQNFRNIPVDKNQETRSLLALADGSLLAGSAKGVIVKYDAEGKLCGYLDNKPVDNGNGRLSLSDVPVNFSDKVYAMFCDKNDNVWIGTKGDGLYVMSPGGEVQHYMRQYRDTRHVDCDTIYDFSYDSRGNLWVGTYGQGIQLVKPRSDGSYEFVNLMNVNKSYPLEDGYRYVRRITHNAKGEVALSCNSGMLTFNDDFGSPADIKIIPTRAINGDGNSLRTSNVMQVLVAKDGTTLVTTMGGEVQRIVGQSLVDTALHFESLGNKDLAVSLSKGNVLSMIQDGNGNYYFVRESDIVAYFPEEHNIVMLGQNVLGGEHEFSEAMPVLGHDGSLYFGAVGSVVKIDPDEVAKEPFAPKIVFTGMQLEGDNQEQFILNPENIVIQPDHRNFALSFAALDYSGYGRIEYSYRFEPDKEWTYLGSSNVLQLTNLKPGVQRLYIRSTNGDGTWVDNEKYVDIMVKPKFSETIWAKILFIFIVLVVLLFLIHYYNVYRRNRLIKLMHQREHDFYVNASHKLRTPLSLIGSPVYEVLQHENLSETGRQHLERVRRNAKNMLQVLNTMLEAEFRPSGLYDEQSSYDAAGDVAPSNKPSYMRSENWLEVKEGDEVNISKDVKILVVEDNDDLRGFLHDILSSQYNIITASNGKEGLEKAEAEQPDFILTDVTMPEMDGLTMVKKIKSKKQLSHIPILVLSAKASMDDRVEGLRIGIDDYISKPFSATYLRQRIANIIAQRRLLQQTFLERLGNDMNRPEGSSEQMAKSSGTDADIVADKQEYRLDSPQIIEADQVMMEKLMKFLEERIGDENLRIEEMAEAVSMGRTVFYGKIKAIVGMSPSDFLRTLRMQRAEELIVKSKMNFSQIAFSVGFSDPKYFTKCFKKETGMTPSEYRQQKSGERKE